MDYWVCTTFPRERYYRDWFLSKKAGRPLRELYQELASKFPQGLADLPLLPEELSGEVTSIADCGFRNADSQNRKTSNRQSTIANRQSIGVS
ncbi:MAG: hypothetical protein DMG06_27775 [Acidobacteria bacterium]|nr:MAG: hypothetical protein DMG06_27775 [Acidobacteriota bacterium]